MKPRGYYDTRAYIIKKVPLSGHMLRGHKTSVLIPMLHVGLYQLDSSFYAGLSFYYRAMHFSAKRGIAIVCRLSVCL